jgi:hypothetical protein
VHGGQWIDDKSNDSLPASQSFLVFFQLALVTLGAAGCFCPVHATTLAHRELGTGDLLGVSVLGLAAGTPGLTRQISRVGDVLGTQGQPALLAVQRLATTQRGSQRAAACSDGHQDSGEGSCSARRETRGGIRAAGIVLNSSALAGDRL